MSSINLALIIALFYFGYHASLFIDKMDKRISCIEIELGIVEEKK